MGSQSCSIEPCIVHLHQCHGLSQLEAIWFCPTFCFCAQWHLATSPRCWFWLAPVIILGQVTGNKRTSPTWGRSLLQLQSVQGDAGQSHSLHIAFQCWPLFAITVESCWCYKADPRRLQFKDAHVLAVYPQQESFDLSICLWHVTMLCSFELKCLAPAM